MVNIHTGLWTNSEPLLGIAILVAGGLDQYHGKTSPLGSSLSNTTKFKTLPQLPKKK